mmetsp:Transcript_13088/g.23494  ORF Transcript_13088/g.23494 Transcript_13088/m.23494 type:complete len:195 (-) Transcript_13088:158-742(-)
MPSLPERTPAAHTPEHTPVLNIKKEAPVVTVSNKKSMPTSTECRENENLSFRTSKKRSASEIEGGSDARVPKSLKSLSAAAARTSSIVQGSRASVVLNSPVVESSNKKRPAVDLPPGESRKKSSIGNPNLFDSDDSAAEEEDKQVVHKARRLRINPNLVLCDADYEGGTIIQPSLELPRGLRRLFLALNAGERI